MLIKKLSLATLLAAASQLALASPSTSAIRFDGAVRGTTCSASVNGVVAPNQATVVLNDAKLERLAKPGDTDGKTRFTVDLKNCSGTTEVLTTFRSANGSLVTDGRLDNMATTNPARNVQMRLGTGSSQLDVDAQFFTWTPIEDGAGSREYWVDYYATGPVQQGAVEGTVEFIYDYP